MTALLDTPLPQLHPLARPVTPLQTASVSRGATSLRPASPAGGATSLLPPAGPPLPASPRQLPPRHQQPRPRARAAATAVCAPIRLTGDRRHTPLATSPRPAALRLTRRARLVLTLSTTLSLLAIVALAMVNAEPMRGQLQDAPASVVVQTGDTLWQIAVDVAPAEDPAVVVDLLRSANELDGSALRPGQVLVVPRG